MKLEKNTGAFFELIRAGLWEQEVRLLPFNPIDFQWVMGLAEEQPVVGLVAAGLEHVTDMKLSKEDVLQFVGQALQLEQQNQAMNYFIGLLVEKMRKEYIPCWSKAKGMHNAMRNHSGDLAGMLISS